jgi:hypothetical protein
VVSWPPNPVNSVHAVSARRRAMRSPKCLALGNESEDGEDDGSQRRLRAVTEHLARLGVMTLRWFEDPSMV